MLTCSLELGTVTLLGEALVRLLLLHCLSYSLLLSHPLGSGGVRSSSSEGDLLSSVLQECSPVRSLSSGNIARVDVNTVVILPKSQCELAALMMMASSSLGNRGNEVGKMVVAATSSVSILSVQ